MRQDGRIVVYVIVMLLTVALSWGFRCDAEEQSTRTDEQANAVFVVGGKTLDGIPFVVQMRRYALGPAWRGEVPKWVGRHDDAVRCKQYPAWCPKKRAPQFERYEHYFQIMPPSDLYLQPQVRVDQRRQRES